MAKTTIVENQEIGVSVSNSDFKLPVYMLGYAPRGPENVDTYFSNYADFVSKFGSTPYYFKSAQYKGNTFWQAQGSAERGYVYAHEYALLNKPGVFRRITKSNAAYCKLTTDIPIKTRKFTYSAACNNKTITVKDVTFTKTGPTSGNYTYTATVAALTDIAFGYLSNCKATLDGTEYTFTVSDTTITYTGTANISDLTSSVSFICKAKSYYVEYTAANKVLRVSTTSTPASASFGTAVTDIAINDIANTRQLVISFPWGDETITADEGTATNTTKVLQIYASSSGAWGTGIKVKVAPIPATNKLIITATYNDGKESESILGDLTYGGDDFICGSDGTKVCNLIKIVNGSTTMGSALSGEEDASMLCVDSMQATSLIYQGGATTDEITVEDIYKALGDGCGEGLTSGEAVAASDYWANLTDKDLNDYAVFTTGAYPLHDPSDANSKAATQLQKIAEYQLGYTIIDSRKRPQGQSLSAEATLLMNDDASRSLINMVAGTNSNGEKNAIYGAMFFDWRAYDTSFGKMELPPSFAYVKALASTGMSANQTKPWEALANDTGTVAIADNNKLGGAISDLLQQNNEAVGVRVNPIQYLKDVGNRIMGNSTLMNNQGELTNYSFLNIRVLTTIIKRYAYKLGNSLKFKTNDINTFLTFQTKMTAFMNKLIDKGLRTEDNNGKRIAPFGIERLPSSEKGKIRIHIWYYPLEAIEIVEETVTLKDGYVEVAE